ncbi:hydrolase of the alpha/beta superfamily [Phaeosphaeriaceae sp. PMI808]|nr:hydrolase of the alpha/beta superfamily [Phaeosphaeriaceae sp. PMI808]
MTTVRQVHFSSRGINVVGDLYLPLPAAPNRKNASIIVGHPGTGIKEQTSGLYARCLAEHGFVTLAFDAAHYGESGGEPRYLEDPYQRVEDFRSAVTFLSTLDGEADPERIGILGICSSGGYSIFAAQTDLRLKAVATVCGVCLGSMTRDSMKNSSGAINQEMLQQGLIYAGKERIAEAKGSQPAAVSILDTFEEAKEYYKTARGQHPRCTNLQLVRSLDTLATYDSYAFIDWISPRPLLMIIGSEADKGTGEAADTGPYSRAAIERAKEPKELFVIKGKGHVDLYDNTVESVPKLVDFMAKSLCI